MHALYRSITRLIIMAQMEQQIRIRYNIILKQDCLHWQRQKKKGTDLRDGTKRQI